MILSVSEKAKYIKLKLWGMLKKNKTTICVKFLKKVIFSILIMAESTQLKLLGMLMLKNGQSAKNPKTYPACDVFCFRKTL